MLKRITRFIDYLNYRGFMLVGTTYLTAASLIGFETLAVILGYATIWPVGAPLLVAGIAGWVVVRRWLSRRRASASGPRGSDGVADDRDAGGDE